MTVRPKPPTEGERSEEPVVLVVDDDKSMREALESLFRSVGLQVKLFASTTDLMSGALPNAPSCLVLDVRLPGVSGLDFQGDLAAAGIHIPIIFMTAFPTDPVRARAMAAGAVCFLTKPFDASTLSEGIKTALHQ